MVTDHLCEPFGAFVDIDARNVHPPWAGCRSDLLDEGDRQAGAAA
jgi:hypothetical protein